MQARKGPFDSRVLRLLLAYTIGVNVFGLSLGLSFVVASLLHLDMTSTAGLVGGIASMGIGLAAGWGTERLLKRVQ